MSDIFGVANSVEMSGKDRIIISYAKGNGSWQHVKFDSLNLNQLVMFFDNLECATKFRDMVDGCVELLKQKEITPMSDEEWQKK